LPNQDYQALKPDSEERNDWYGEENNVFQEMCQVWLFGNSNSFNLSIEKFNNKKNTSLSNSSRWRNFKKKEAFGKFTLGERLKKIWSRMHEKKDERLNGKEEKKD